MKESDNLIRAICGLDSSSEEATAFERIIDLAKLQMKSRHVASNAMPESIVMDATTHVSSALENTYPRQALRSVIDVLLEKCLIGISHYAGHVRLVGFLMFVHVRSALQDWFQGVMLHRVTHVL